MSAPYRIVKPEARGMSAAAETQDPNDGVKGYLDRLMKMIPGEVVALYLLGNNLIPAADPKQAVVRAVWAFICLLGVVAVKAYGTADAKNQLPPDWTHVAISCVSFMVYLYTDPSGVFAAFGLWVPYLGSLLMLAWIFFIPIFYRGSDVGGTPVAVGR